MTEPWLDTGVSMGHLPLAVDDIFSDLLIKCEMLDSQYYPLNLCLVKNEGFLLVSFYLWKLIIFNCGLLKKH